MVDGAWITLPGGARRLTSENFTSSRHTWVNKASLVRHATPGSVMFVGQKAERKPYQKGAKTS